MANRIMLAAAMLAAFGFAPAPLPRPHRHARQDQTDIAGVWEFVRWDRHGAHEPNSENSYLLTLKQDAMTFTHRRDETQDAGVYLLTLHPHLTPPAFEMRYNGKDNPPSHVGSYRLSGDAMTMVFDMGSDLARRPTDFGGTPQLKFVLRRIRR